MAAFLLVMFVPVIVRAVLWIAGIALAFAAWSEWKKGPDRRDPGTLVGFLAGAFLCYAIAKQI